MLFGRADGAGLRDSLDEERQSRTVGKAMPSCRVSPGPRPGAAWLRSALEALLSGSELGPDETEPIGCSVKWRS
jgi:hypothetical protein